MGETEELQRSVQMRLYSFNKRQFVGIFVLFYLSLLLTFSMGFLAPHVIQSIDGTFSNRSKQLAAPYEIQSDYLDRFHQRLWLTMRPITDVQDEFAQSINVSMTLLNPTLKIQLSTRQRTTHCQKKVSQKMNV